MRILFFCQALSNKKHYDAEEHNPDYDHEAFLGEEAKSFDQLSPEESKERLGFVRKASKSSVWYF